MIELSPMHNVTVFRSQPQSHQDDKPIETSDLSLPKRKFTILFTGDMHSFLEPSKNSNPNLQKYGSELGGVVRRVNYISQIIQKGESVILLDAGDFLTGTAFFEIYKGSSDIEMMNMASYHIVTIGNHDLDKGWDHLKELLTKAKFRAVCANISDSQTENLILPPYEIVSIQELQVAVIGLMGKDAWTSIHPSAREKLQLMDPDETLNEILQELRPKMDLIILLSHSGILADREFAKNHPDIDMIIGGHSHTYMEYAEEIPSSSKITPLFHAYKHGQFLGHVTIEMNSQSQVYGTSLVPMDSRWDTNEFSPLRSEIQLYLDSYREELSKHYSQVIGRCIQPLPKDNISKELVPLGIILCDIFRQSTQADIAFYPSNGIRNGFIEGEVTLKEISEIVPLEPLFTIEVTGTLIRQMMKKGEERWPSGRQTFQYAGISMNKNSILLVGEEPLQDEKFYKLTSCSFFFERENILLSNRRINQELLNSHIKEEIIEHSKSTHETLRQWIETKGIETIYFDKDDIKN